MKPLAWLAAALLPAGLSAGPVYGVILFNAQALRGASVRIDCPGARQPATGSTLDDGSYRVQVPQQGRCTFTVRTGGLQTQTEIVSLQDAAQYNFEVITTGGNRYELRRK